MLLSQNKITTKYGEVTLKFLSEEKNNNIVSERYAFENKNTLGFFIINKQNDIVKELMLRKVDTYMCDVIKLTDIITLLNKFLDTSIIKSSYFNDPKVLQILCYNIIALYGQSFSNLKKLTNKSPEKIKNEIIDKKNKNSFIGIDGILYILVSIVSSMIPIIFFIIFYYKKFIHVRDYNKAVELDNKLNDMLFGKDSKIDNSIFDFYIDLISLLQDTIKNEDKNGLLLYGPPGTGKTFIIRKVLYDLNLKSGEDYVITKGSTENIASLYILLYKFKNKLLVLDDFDSALKDIDTINLLKAACDTYPIRIVSFPPEKKFNADTGEELRDAPDKFEFKGKIIIATNLTFEKLDKALISRLGAYELKFDGEQMIKIMEKMVASLNPKLSSEDKYKVIEFLKYLKTTYNINLDLRDLKFALDCYQGFPHRWKEIVEKVLKNKGI